MEDDGAAVAPGQAAASTSQIQSAIDQLTYLHRILHGDDEMSLSELLASTSASGPSSSLPSGGLARALPALVNPLLPGGELSGGSESFQFASNNLSLAQRGLLAKRAAFQPRRYLAMTGELATRTSDSTGEMFRAVQLAQSLMKSPESGWAKERERERVLQDRKRRRDQGERVVPDAPEGQERELAGAPFKSRLSYVLPSRLHGQAKEMQPSLREEPVAKTVKRYIYAWQRELSVVDVEALGQVRVVLQQWLHGEERRRCLLRARIGQAGFAWLWVRFDPINQSGFAPRVYRINFLAESEVEESTMGKRSLSLALQPSRFPLYRRITALLHTKLGSMDNHGQPTWAHLTTALFAVATLCRLHELQGPTFLSATLLRGQENILNGLLHLDVTTDDGEEGSTSAQEAASTHSPMSNLFGDQID